MATDDTEDRYQATSKGLAIGCILTAGTALGGEAKRLAGSIFDRIMEGVAEADVLEDVKRLRAMADGKPEAARMDVLVMPWFERSRGG